MKFGRMPVPNLEIHDATVNVSAPCTERAAGRFYRKLLTTPASYRVATCAQDTTDPNLIKSKLLGGFLRRRLLENMTSSDPAKELVKRSFRCV